MGTDIISDTDNITQHERVTLNKQRKTGLSILKNSIFLNITVKFRKNMRALKATVWRHKGPCAEKSIELA